MRIERDVKPEGREFFWNTDRDRRHCRGTVIIKTSDRWTTEAYEHDNKGRIGRLKIKQDNTTYTLHNVYGPANHTDDDRFFQDLDRLIDDSDRNILGGDFNTTTDPHDKTNLQHDRGMTKTIELKKIMTKHKLTDPYRQTDPLGTETTFESTHGNKTRLDKFLTTRNVQVQQIQHLSETKQFTDHKAVLARFGHSMKEKNSKSPYWKFNNSLLENRQYTDAMTNIINDHIQNMTDTDAIENWEIMKKTIKIRTIHIATTINRERKQKEKEYKDMLEILDDTDPDSKTATTLRTKLQEIQQHKNRGHQIRCSNTLRTEDIEELHDTIRDIENSTQKKKLITKIYDTTGNITTDQDRIRNSFHEYYATLYKKDETDRSIRNKYTAYAKKITDIQKEHTDKEITVVDLENTIKQMNNGKSPGPDGLTVEFYKFFFPQLKNGLIKLIHDIYQTGNLAPSQRLSYITLIPKKDSDHKQMKNYRPISLLNTDYKLITKTLANKIKTILPTLIHEDQTCAIPGRTIEQNTHYIRDLIIYAEQTQTQTYVVSIDQEKAFDRLDHKYIHETLENNNIGNYIRTWIDIIYKNPESCVVVNQEISQPFKIERSVRQGCPLSAMIYTICLENFLEAVRKDPLIQGTKIPGAHIKKLVAYADDTTFFTPNLKSIHNLIGKFKEYGKGSGAKINVEKSKVMTVGIKQNNNTPLEKTELEWVTDIKILGIVYDRTGLTTKKHWKKLIHGIKRKIHKYKHLHTTIFDRVRIANTYLTPKIFYTIKIQNPPGFFTKEIKNTIKNYISKHTNHNISSETLTAPTEFGGLGLHDITNILQTARLKFINDFIRNPDNSPLTKYYLTHRLSKFIKSNHTSPNFGGLRLPPFYEMCGNLILKFENIIGKNLESEQIHSTIIKNNHRNITYETRLPYQIAQVAIKNMKQTYIRKTTKDTTFKFLFHLLPTDNNTKCHLCEQELTSETRHLMIQCNTTKPIIQDTIRSIQKTSPQEIHTELALISNIFPKTPHETHKQNNILLAETRQAIWTARQLSKINNIKINSSTIRKILNSNINRGP